MLLADLEEQFARDYTPQEAVKLMRQDFASDPAIVEVGTPDCYLGSLFLEDDLQTVSILVGSTHQASSFKISDSISHPVCYLGCSIEWKSNAA